MADMKRLKIKLFLGIATALILLTSCIVSGDQQMSDYDETKKMVVDILKSDEGKQALRKMFTDDELKHLLILQDGEVKTAIEATLLSEQGEDFWKNLFENQEFASIYAKSLQKEHEKLLKDLLKDPGYREKLIELYTDPEVKQDILKLMKSTEFRKQTESVIMETFESPLFQAKIADILISGAEKIKEAEGEKEKEEDQSEDEIKDGDQIENSNS